MKWLKAIVLIMVVSVLFSGCSFRLASSVDELISPVSPQGDNADIQNTLTEYAKETVTIKSPMAGDNTTAFTFYDIDADGEKEAFIFYVSAQSNSGVNLAVIDKINSEWVVVSDLNSENSEVYSLGFSDLNGDGSAEIIVLWNVLSKSRSHNMSVYKYASGSEITLKQSGKSVELDEYILVDTDNDGINEVLTLLADSSGSNSSSAALHSFKNDSYSLLGTTKLDGKIITYSSLTSDVREGRTYIYADAVKSNGSQMLTEIIYWSDYYDTIISPYYSYSTATTKGTSRKAMLYCQDINVDGFVEVPLDADFNVPDGVYAVDWCAYDNSMLSHSAYSVAVEKDGYQLLVDDEIIEQFRFEEYDPADSVLRAFDKNGNIAFEIKSVMLAQYEEAAGEFKDFTEIMSSSGYAYLARLGNDSAVDITTNDLKRIIRTYEGG